VLRIAVTSIVAHPGVIPGRLLANHLALPAPSGTAKDLMPDPTAEDRFTALLAEHGPRLRKVTLTYGVSA
jgi:hypothetical protein